MAKKTEKEWENHRFPRESALQNYVIKRLNRLPRVYVTKVSGTIYGSGISDLLICAEGKFVAIELKIGNNKPSDLQKLYLSNIKKAGGIVGVAYTWGDVKRILGKAVDVDKLIEEYEEEKRLRKAEEQ